MLDYQEIINKRSEEGYNPYLQERLGIIFNSIDDSKGNPKFNSISQIRIEKKKLSYNTFRADSCRERI